MAMKPDELNRLNESINNLSKQFNLPYQDAEILRAIIDCSRQLYMRGVRDGISGKNHMKPPKSIEGLFAQMLWVGGCDFGKDSSFNENGKVFDPSTGDEIFPSED